MGAIVTYARKTWFCDALVPTKPSDVIKRSWLIFVRAWSEHRAFAKHVWSR